MYRESGLLKRFLAYIIDNMAIIFVLYLLIILLTPVFGLETKEVPQALVDFTNSSEFSIGGLLDLMSTNKDVALFFDSILPYMYTVLLTTFVIYIVYFAVVPSYAKNFQTIGRFITKTNVVDQEGYLVGFKANFLRLLGDILVMLLNSVMGIGMALNVFFVLTRNRTIGDMLAKTKFIDLTRPVEVVVIDQNDDNDEQSYPQM